MTNGNIQFITDYGIRRNRPYMIIKLKKKEDAYSIKLSFQLMKSYKQRNRENNRNTPTPKWNVRKCDIAKYPLFQ